MGLDDCLCTLGRAYGTNPPRPRGLSFWEDKRSFLSEERVAPYLRESITFVERTAAHLEN